MNVKLLIDHHLEFLSLKGGCTCSSESTFVKVPHCLKSHFMALIFKSPGGLSCCLFPGSNCVAFGSLCLLLLILRVFCMCLVQVGVFSNLAIIWMRNRELTALHVL